METITADINWKSVFQGVSSQLQEGLVVTDACLDGEGPRVQRVNEQFEEMFGFSNQKITGRPLLMLLDYKRGETILSDLRDHIGGGEPHRFVLYEGNHSTPWLDCRCFPVKDDEGRLSNLVFMFKEKEERGDNKQLQYMAYYDSLTGLPNRHLYQARLELALGGASRAGSKVAVLFVDLDGFKNVNDELGHQLGDHFLKVLSQRLQSSIRSSDTVARMGGDEFAFIFTDIDSKQDIYPLAEKVRKEIEKPIKIGDEEEWAVGASIGVSYYPEDGETSTALLERADHAMYRTKKCGGGDIDFYSVNSYSSDSKAGRLRGKFLEALDKNEFVIHYQPEVDIATGKIMYLEALIRWDQPNEGLLFPGQFLVRSEMIGMLSKIEEWALARICRQVTGWQKKHKDVPAVSINLSGESLLHRDMLEMVPRIVWRSGTDPKLLQVELSEPDALRDIDFAVSEFERLNVLGVKTCLDHFGTQLSSLKHLDLFPVDKLKLATDLVKEIPSDKNAVLIAKNVIKSGRLSGREVLPVGVENNLQLKFFKDNGCSLMQGNIFSAPRDSRDIEELIKPAKIYAGVA